MEILNNTVIIPAEISVDEGTNIITLKVPGQVLFDLYSNGKRCICKIELDAPNEIVFEIIAASRIRSSVNNYEFVTIFRAGNKALTVSFASEDLEEPSYIVEES